ncbi:MAG TPA: hypothetical protein VFD70_02175 [Anaerolineae bacterium]|nr:hypothetical protein [Anaerolineae bacterium]
MPERDRYKSYGSKQGRVRFYGRAPEIYHLTSISVGDASYGNVRTLRAIHSHPFPAILATLNAWNNAFNPR